MLLGPHRRVGLRASCHGGWAPNANGGWEVGVRASRQRVHLLDDCRSHTLRGRARILVMLMPWLEMLHTMCLRTPALCQTGDCFPPSFASVIIQM